MLTVLCMKIYWQFSFGWVLFYRFLNMSLNIPGLVIDTVLLLRWWCRNGDWAIGDLGGSLLMNA